jgi:hypothetical protein
LSEGHHRPTADRGEQAPGARRGWLLALMAGGMLALAAVGAAWVAEIVKGPRLFELARAGSGGNLRPGCQDCLRSGLGLAWFGHGRGNSRRDHLGGGRLVQPVLRAGPWGFWRSYWGAIGGAAVDGPLRRRSGLARDGRGPGPGHGGRRGHKETQAANARSSGPVRAARTAILASSAIGEPGFALGCSSLRLRATCRAERTVLRR